LPGTPIELRVQDGIPPEELALLRDGVQLADRYLDRRVGGGVRKRGGLPEADEHQLLWFVEGMAVFVPFRAITAAGRAPPRSEARWRRTFEGGEGPVTEPLAAFERQGGGDRQ
jgi:hypothetical protein